MSEHAGSMHEQLEHIWLEAARDQLPLPPEAELAKRIGVSRAMLREALVSLEARGLVSRRAHQGTFPNVSALSMSLRIDQSYELSGLLTDAGFDVSVDVISADWSTLDEVEAADLGAAPGSSCLRVMKRWLGDGKPRIVAEDVIPARSRDDVAFDSAYPLYETVAQLRGETVEWESARIAAVLPDPSWRAALEVGETHPALSITLVGVSLHGTRLFRARELHVMDGLEYGMVRRGFRST